MRARSALLVLTSLASALFALACDGGGTAGSGGAPGGAGGSGGAQGGSGGGTAGSGLFVGGSGGQFLGSLVVQPPVATIDVVDGVSQPVDLSALRGSTEVPASWVVDLSSVATVDATGLVTATGALGGDVTVKATENGETAQALVTVALHVTQNPGSLSGADIAVLEGASLPDASVAWTYPYDKTVFPKGLSAPELMWNGGGAGDKYMVKWTAPNAEVKLFVTADPPSRFQTDANVWKVLTESGKGGDLKLKVTRLPAGGGQAGVVVDHTYKIANGSLKGTVYYWANSLGRVLRIKPGQGGPDDFQAAYLSSLPPGESQCTTCHVVSANGSTLVIGGDAPVSTWDLLSNNFVLDLVSVGKARRNWAMPAISPNGKYVVENNAPLPGPPGGSDGMFDAATGAKIAGTGLDGIFLDMPAFSPDGTHLAYVDHNDKSLGAFSYDAVNNLVSAPVSLVPQGASSIAFPSMSPDGKWVVYHRGSLDTRFGPGDLFLASVEQPGAEAPLDALNGATYPFNAGDRDRHYNYEPTFAPLSAGGYFWVVFTSRRTYGNRLTGTADQTKQLWVAAIDINAQPGVDASHPAFWVPGQDVATWNMRGYWALDPCKQAGDSCSTGSECCNQNCNAGVCEDPDPNECAQTGNFCTVDADCCDPGVTCINHICSEPPPN